MLDVLQCLALTLSAIALAPALAHALERPGKARLSEEQYSLVQRIYYPGFTALGFAEPVAIIGAVALLAATPSGTGFWLVAFALIALAAMHTVYWVVTHPVNKTWLRGEKLGSAGATFFGTGVTVGTETTAGAGARGRDWTMLRDRWEHSHLARAALGATAFLALAGAVSMD